MDVDLILKLPLSVIVAVLNQVLIRSGREEQAMLTTCRIDCCFIDYVGR